MSANLDAQTFLRRIDLLQRLPAKGSGQKITARELVEQLTAAGYAVEKRTIERDLEFLRERDPNANATKYEEMFERRARKGRCVNQPYLGCREFAAAFRLVDEPGAEPQPIADTRDLGFMLDDLDFANATDPQPRFFRARLENGVVVIPRWDSPEVHA